MCGLLIDLDCWQAMRLSITKLIIWFITWQNIQIYFTTNFRKYIGLADFIFPEICPMVRILKAQKFESVKFYWKIFFQTLFTQTTSTTCSSEVELLRYSLRTILRVWLWKGGPEFGTILLEKGTGIFNSFQLEFSPHVPSAKLFKLNENLNF